LTDVETSVAPVGRLEFFVGKNKIGVDIVMIEFKDLVINGEFLWVLEDNGHEIEIV
jgi:hypothetical protein